MTPPDDDPDALASDAHYAEHEAWSAGYDKGFAAAKRLCAALAVEPVPAPLDVDWGQVQAAFTNMVAVRDAPVLDDEFWMAVRAEYARLATPPEPKP